jgi:hypothetical protein
VDFGCLSQKNKDFSRFGGFWTFRARRIRICPDLKDLDVAGQKNKALSWFGKVLDVSGQKNKDLSRFGRFGMFKPKESGFVPFCGIWTLQAKRIKVCPVIVDSGRFRPKE